VVPALNAEGKRLTINRDLGELETLWHFRAAYNVGGLSCLEGGYANIATDYNLFLQKHKSTLRSANTAIEGKFRREHGSNYRRIRDTHTTRVYNFFSFPPVKQEFCQTIQTLGQQALAISDRENLIIFASGALPRLEGIYDRFYADYEAYQAALADWQLRYGNNAADDVNVSNQVPVASEPANTGG
jgi:hypothetical protein